VADDGLKAASDVARRYASLAQLFCFHVSLGAVAARSAFRCPSLLTFIPPNDRKREHNKQADRNYEQDNAEVDYRLGHISVRRLAVRRLASRHASSRIYATWHHR
jgi:hypothetical protein